MENYHKYAKIKDIVNPNLKTPKVQNLINYCQQNNYRFKDQEFPPDRKSLIGSPPA